MIQIKPILLGLQQKEGTQILIRPIISSTQSLACNTYYEVCSDDNEVLATGNIAINEEQYKQWADDNTFIENIVLENLKLNRYE